MNDSREQSSQCQFCNDEGWVCENHPHKPWASYGCRCGAGMPCGCNEDAEVQWDEIFSAVGERDE